MSVLPQTARITGGIRLAKKLAERHIKIAPMVVVMIDRERSTSE